MSATDPAAAIREITEAAQAYCEGLKGYPGPYEAIGAYVRCGKARVVTFATPRNNLAIAAALNHAPAGWDARLRVLLDDRNCHNWHLYDEARAAVDRALARQRGEG